MGFFFKAKFAHFYLQDQLELGWSQVFYENPTPMVYNIGSIIKKQSYIICLYDDPLKTEKQGFWGDIFHWINDIAREDGRHVFEHKVLFFRSGKEASAA